MTALADLRALAERLRATAGGQEITSESADEEIVFCGEQDGEYVGWTPRETAIRCGYTVHTAEVDQAKIDAADAIDALVEVAEAAQAFYDAEVALARLMLGHTPTTRSDGGEIAEHAQIALADALDALAGLGITAEETPR